MKTGTDIRVTVHCTGCTAPLKRYPMQIEKSKTGRWFCSTACRDRVGSKPRRKAMVTCKVCPTEFYPRRGGTNEYCSVECLSTARKAGRVERTCTVCGKVEEVPPSQASFPNCSRRCYEIGRSTPVGTRQVNDDGYILVFRPESSEAWKGDHRKAGWALEHRIVMSEMIGHPLPKGSTVHHRNGTRSDNRPENLELWASTHRPGQRVLDLLEYADWILATFNADRERLRELEA